MTSLKWMAYHRTRTERPSVPSFAKRCNPSSLSGEISASFSPMIGAMGFQAVAARPSQVRQAFTMVELLVVMTVIGVMLALAITAVQSARESARQMQCQSHLRQLGLAAHHFESMKRSLPSGGWGFQWPGYLDVNSPAGQPGGWTHALLPFMEQTALYELGNYQGPQVQRDRDLSRRVTTPVPIYTCPSRRGGEPQPFDPGCASCSLPVGASVPLEFTTRCDYAANVGDGAPEMSEIDSWPVNYWGPPSVAAATQLVRTGHWPQPPKDWTGLMWLGRGVRFAEITDGTSHVFLFGEKHVMSTAYGTGQDWGDNEPLYSGFNNDSHRSTNRYWPLMRDQATAMSIGSFGAAHIAGANFVMADGSVHLVSYSVDQEIYSSLGNRRDGKAMEVPN